MAAQGEGVPWSTMTRWLAEDEEFRDHCHQAWAEGCDFWQRKIARVGVEAVPDASALANIAKFYLAGHDREAWADQTRIEHSGNVGIFQAASATLKDRETRDDDGGAE